ncbi:tetratricopeptide repeat protein [Saccharothrix texasensis]|uniref:tetratricopeptide repeat protein n=1 Tax=Saccharothrix texasensis TaxID=103734 RepID=UPI00147712C9|nr:tetratricopeptide repeat protein [Saccharothrix texasensis]
MDDVRRPSQWAWAESGGNVQQAGRDIRNDTYDVRLSPGHGPGLVSVEAPWGRLPERLRGRDDISADLAGLVADPPGRLVVLHGAGGYGKSTLALWLARHAADRQVPVWWVSADNAQALAGGLREVALQAGANPVSVELAWSGRASAPDLLWRTLDAVDGRWVLVVDNADDPDVLSGGGRLSEGTGWLRPPEPGHGLVVVTSRQGNPRSWPRHTDQRLLTGIDAADAGLVLTDLAGPRAGSLPEAQRLGDRLGGLPLALRLAGSYLAAADDALLVPGAELPRTFVDYQAALDARVDVLDAPPADHDEERDERELISRTWELSLDLLARRGHPRARPLLRLLSFFGQAPIPVDVLDATLLATVPTWAATTPETVSRLLRVLLDLGLVDRADLPDRQAVTLHRLIRDTNRHHAAAEPDVHQHAIALVKLVHAATRTPPIAQEAWSRRHALASHAEAALELCRAHLDHVPPDLVEQAITAGREAAFFRRHVYDLDRAAVDFQVILDCQRQALGEHHPDTLATRTDLAVVRGAPALPGQPDQAEAELSEVLDVQRRVLGDHHPDTLRTRHALAGRLAERGDWPAAEQAHRRTTEIAQRELGPDHEATLAGRHALAQALYSLGRSAEAETEFHAALQAHRRVFGEEHANTLATWHGYATVLADLEKPAAAAVEFRSILRIQERKSGEHSEPALSARHGLGHSLRRLGRNTEAKAEYEAVLDLGRPTLGDEHPGILTCRANLAALRAELGDTASAETELRDVLEIQCRVHGLAHPATLQTRLDLASLMALNGDTPSAEALLWQVVVLGSPTLGLDHPMIRLCRLLLNTVTSSPTPRRDTRRPRRAGPTRRRRRR